jgi:HD-GYP domain-containing protein (c-di-GMP phosphodiesterase class II)
MSALLVLSGAIEARDPYMRGHSARVARLAHEVGRRLRCDDIQLSLLHLGGALHDVGKVAVSEAILNKPGPLTELEVAEVRTHPEAGARLVALDRTLRPALPAVLYHHERWDGDGYPSGRASTQIPLEARILAVVDCYDAMTSDRPYRAALPPERAIEEVDRCAGAQFDPDVALAFIAAWESGAFGVTAALRAAARLSERRPDLELRPDAADHLVGELARPRVAAEIGRADALGNRLQA